MAVVKRVAKTQPKGGQAAEQAEEGKAPANETYRYSVWLEAPHDQVWRAIKDQLEHPRPQKGQVNAIQVLERKKNYLVREVKPKRGRKFQEKITFFSSMKAISEMSKGPYESISQEVTREKGRTKLTMEFRPRKFTRWLLKFKQWVKRAPLELDDLLNLTNVPKPTDGKK